MTYKTRFRSQVSTDLTITCSVLEMKIWIYWFKSNSWIYLYIDLKKNWKIDWSKQSFVGLGLEDKCLSWGLYHCNSSIMNKHNKKHVFFWWDLLWNIHNIKSLYVVIINDIMVMHQQSTWCSIIRGLHTEIFNNHWVPPQTILFI